MFSKMKISNWKSHVSIWNLLERYEGMNSVQPMEEIELQLLFFVSLKKWLSKESKIQRKSLSSIIWNIGPLFEFFTTFLSASDDSAFAFFCISNDGTFKNNLRFYFEF